MGICVHLSPEGCEATKPSLSASGSRAREKSKRERDTIWDWSVSRSVMAISSKMFRRGQQPRPQPQSPLLKLPLELRFDIYTYIFASSIIHEPTKEPLSTWDNLLLSCRQAKVEMENLPVRPIISMVQARWCHDFPEHPLQVSAVVEKGYIREISVAIPRAVFQAGYLADIPKYIPYYVSPLFRIFSDIFILKILDDGSPLINDVSLMDAVEHLYPQMQSMIFARERSSFIRNRILPVPPTPCSRNFLNANKIVMSWEGTLEEEIEIGGKFYVFVLYCDQILFKVIRIRLGLGKKKLIGEWTKEKTFIVHTISWASKKRFRR